MTNQENSIKKIVIQGGYGAFHDIAAHHYFENQQIEVLPRDTFKDMMKSLKKRQADYGIMAIENSLAGSILPNYSLIKGSKMKIIGVMIPSHRVSAATNSTYLKGELFVM